MILCMSFAGIIVYKQSAMNLIKQRRPLKSEFAIIGDWHALGENELDVDIRDALNLDDFLFSRYFCKDKSISLYIGYYYNNKKVGEAHSPLVCYPGQGWQVSKKRNTTISISKHTIRLSTIITSKGLQREVVLYWFQAFDRSFPDTFLQKIYAVWAKLKYGEEDNAFVRISVPINAGSEKEAFDIGVRFIQSFYPIFHAYIISPEERPKG